MFTGIIQTIGKIKKLEDDSKTTTLIIEAKDIFKNKRIGSSIAVDGVCLTIVKKTTNSAEFNLMNTTLQATKLKDVKEGDTVNLEPSLTFGQGLDGHLVQGHIDTTGEVIDVNKSSTQTVLHITYPKSFRQLLSNKGSVTLNGVSLTVSNLNPDFFEVSLVDHTLEITNLSEVKVGDKVNIEFDAIAKYLKSLLEARGN
jgi:riboflavin synthase